MATNQATDELKSNINKPKKRNKLRYLEYYDMQPELDELYRKSQKGAHFKNLMQLILDTRNIDLAYRTIKRNTGSTTKGTDGKTIKDWENQPPEYYHNYITSRLLDYKPQKVRRVEIPKANGKTRPLGVPTIGDRLVQQCIKQVLEPICEAKFYEHSYGFRPNRSTKHALARAKSHSDIGKCYFVVDIDIKGFFDNVNHSKLMKQLWSMGIRDKSLLCVISKMLKAEIEGIGIPDKGVPQGGILSPLLSNIVLNELDWWISDQWLSFETDRIYWSNPKQPNGAKFRSLRNSSKLKEIYLVRYADDFKIYCKSKSVADKIFLATKQWLKERLGLEISPEKSKVIDLRKQSSEFLGFRMKLQKKDDEPETTRLRSNNKRSKRKWSVITHISDKSRDKIITSLTSYIKVIQKNPTIKNVNLYNSAVLGMQQYYKVATHVNLDFNDIAFQVNKVVHNRTKQIQAKVSKRTQTQDFTILRNNKRYKNIPKLIVSETYLKYYKNNYRKKWIAGVALFPIGDVQTDKAQWNFNQKICNFTITGREFVHDDRVNLNMETLHYMMRNPIENASIEFNDNRISLYSGQYGICGISDKPLELHDMEVHHKLPKKLGGTDAYSNLIIVTNDVHKLIHATEPETILFYSARLKLKAVSLKKLNKLRELVGNFSIKKIT